jgi:XTP/dITP diphosphohydrolase
LYNKRNKLLLATNNLGKVREMVELLKGVPFEITTPAAEGISLDVEETGSTFEENAILKAKAFSKKSGLLSLADDSGLQVYSLDLEPGVLSARYAGEHASDKEKVRHLLHKMKNIERDRRQARFCCVMAMSNPEAGVEIFDGVCEGMISEEPKGSSGFGYDPVFYIPSVGKHMAELSMNEKNSLSHRGIAAQKVLSYLVKMV